MQIKHLSSKVLLILFLGGLSTSLPSQTAGPNSSSSEKKVGLKPQPTAGAHIVKYYVEAAVPGSTYDTGPLHILYSDGTHIVQRLPRKKKSTESNVVYNVEGYSDAQLAEDGQTLGWTEDYDNCCTSYSISLALVVLRSGTILQRISTGQMIWSWTFLEGGKQVAIVTGPTHGTDVGDYILYDVKTGKDVGHLDRDDHLEGLKPDAPAWAKELEAKTQSGRGAK